MSLVCSRCSRVLEYSGERPSFCAYCGQPLRDPGLEVTTDHESARSPSPSGTGHGSGDVTVPYVSAGSVRAAVASAPTQVAGYRLIRPLGSGGMGTVYEAEDSGFGRKVALKLIAPEFVSSEDAVERFRQEGRLAGTIEHPRCVFVLAADEEHGRPYIIMELMPGGTLQTLVEERGPLPVEEAIAKILDVIEGLQEAHQLGVIHRDVKPSNCFVEEDGRVKVGDFGLSKSLASDSHLTRTGAFIGTPLYASPEQIKGDPVDERTDVYSTAATLYFLLTGRPPFREPDAAATLARIVSEAPTSLRSLRPEIPASLEMIVLRAMDRDRERRFRSLTEFRDALVPFVPNRLSIGGIGLRLVAFAADFGLLLALRWIVLGTFLLIRGVSVSAAIDWVQRHSGTVLGSELLIAILYFTLIEGLLGWSVGKRLVGLRVSAVPEGGAPGLVRGLVRTLVFYGVTALPSFLASLLIHPTESRNKAALYGTVSIVLRSIGYLAIISTMRERNGYRGPHEWLSQTRTVRLPALFRKRAPRTRRKIRPTPAAARRPVGVLESLGPYRVRGAVKWETDRRVLLGEDSTLGRQVWIVLSPRGTPVLSPSRRDLVRPTRPRWLGGGEQPEGRWDAFVAPSGCPLADLAGAEGLSWSESRPMLEDLAHELAASCAEGTLPRGLSIDQVWVQPDGSLQLLDPLGSTATTGEAPRPSEDSAATNQRALKLLRETAALALQGGRIRASDPATSIRAPVPAHVSAIFDRLLGKRRQYDTVLEVCHDLNATHDLPTEVTLARRAAHLGGQAVLLLPFLIIMALAAYGHASLLGRESDVLLALPALWVVWAFLTRGGLSLKLAGMNLVRSDGRPAGRLRCAWRSLLVWAPVAGLMLLASELQKTAKPAEWLPMLVLGIALALPVAWFVLALCFPSRSLHDRASGTHVVPL